MEITEANGLIGDLLLNESLSDGMEQKLRKVRELLAPRMAGHMAYTPRMNVVNPIAEDRHDHESDVVTETTPPAAPRHHVGVSQRERENVVCVVCVLCVCCVRVVCVLCACCVRVVCVLCVCCVRVVCVLCVCVLCECCVCITCVCQCMCLDRWKRVGCAANILLRSILNAKVVE